MSSFVEFVDKMAEHSLEDDANSTAANVAEPLIAKMGPGKNYYTRKQYRALVRYLLDDESAARAARRVRFSIGNIEILSNRYMPESRKVTVSVLAKIAGLPRQNVDLWLSQTNVPFEMQGKRKVYDIDNLREFLSKCQ